jgi:ankyrin repeat protein
MSLKSSKSNQQNPLMLLEAAASMIDQERSDRATESKNPELELELEPEIKKPKLIPTDREQDINAFKTAAIEGDLQTLDRLLTVKHIHPGVCNNIGVIEAARNGQFHICKRLLEDSRTNPTDQRNYAIRMAVRNGHTDILRLFLEHSKADPSADNNYPIRVASLNGHLEIVKLLLKDPRVDPTVKDYYPIRYASKNRHWDVVNVLLEDSRVNIFELLDASRKNGRLFQPLVDKLERILARREHTTLTISTDNPISPISTNVYTPKYETQDLLVLNASQGLKQQVESLVKEYKSSIIKAIIASAEHGQIEIIKYLLKEFPSLDLTPSESAALRNSIMKHQSQMAAETSIKD